mmetsp:Transcript_38491/g.151892  ORF Transcript_38491/g.151892 Transcript_38491/m.151892 type:complete len:90 (+) Transcript_38491:391-660(+)
MDGVDAFFVEFGRELWWAGAEGFLDSEARLVAELAIRSSSALGSQPNAPSIGGSSPLCWKGVQDIRTVSFADEHNRARTNTAFKKIAPP